MCHEASCTLSSQHTRSPPPLSSEPTCQVGAVPGHLAAFAPAEPRSTSGSLMAQHDLWLSSWGWQPRRERSDSALRQQQCECEKLQTLARGPELFVRAHVATQTRREPTSLKAVWLCKHARLHLNWYSNIQSSFAFKSRSRRLNWTPTPFIRSFLVIK